MCLYFYIPQYYNLVGGYIIKQLPWGPGITRPMHAPELDQVYRSWWELQANASQEEPVLGLFHLFYLNDSRTLRVPPCKFWQSWRRYLYILIIVSKFEVWKGRNLASLRHCVGLSWLTECLTETFRLTDRDKALKIGTVPAKTGRMVSLTGW